MPENLKTLRIKSKLEEIFEDRIDLQDASNETDTQNKFLTRAIAALALIIRCGIDVETAVQHITDGYHDTGIDALYNDTAQKKLILVQSKWRNSSDQGISQEEVQTFTTGAKRIISLEFEGCNERILSMQPEVTSAIKDIDYQVELIFCHTASQKINQYALRPVNELLKCVNEDDSLELVTFTELNIQSIYEYLANGQNENISLDNVMLRNWGTVDAPYKSYYGTIPVSAIGEWYSRYGNRLFAKNIRYYKGSTEVNQGIKNVLKTEPDKFFYYNNGIKLLCKKITKKVAYSAERDVGLFSLEGVSLVNGAQTTGVIGTLYLESPESIISAQIFVQMIDLGENAEDQANQITKLSNTQNRIDGKDFVSLDPNQEKLRLELNLGGIQYLYKTGARIDDLEHQISLDETIVAQAGMLSDLSIVALAKRNIGALTENIEKAPYKLLFNGGTNSFSMYNAVLVLRAVDECISQMESTASGRKRLVLVHGNRFLLHLVLKKVKSLDGFDTSFLTQNTINTAVSNVFVPIWEKVYASMEEHFPDAYPAHIFKNIGRLKELEINEL